MGSTTTAHGVNQRARDAGAKAGQHPQLRGGRRRRNLRADAGRKKFQAHRAVIETTLSRRRNNGTVRESVIGQVGSCGVREE